MTTINKFNRGEIDPSVLARDDVERVNNSAEQMENWIPLRMGPMKYRQGIAYAGECLTKANTGERALIPLTRSIGDVINFEFLTTTMRPLDDLAPIACSTATDSGWTNGDITSDTGYTKVGTALYSGGAYILESGDAIHQTSSVGQNGDKQTFRITISKNPCRCMIGGGTSAYATDLVDAYLMPGTHYIQFTPSTDQFTITLQNNNRALWYNRYNAPECDVEECKNLSSGNIEFTVPNLDWKNVSYVASADVLFLALGADNHPKVIKRRGEDSYSFEDYLFLDGPYEPLNTSNINVDATTTSSGYAGIVAAEASGGPWDEIFEAEHADRLIKIAIPDQIEYDSFTAAAQSSSAIGVYGYGTDRDILIEINGTFVGTVYLQKSESGSTWETVYHWKSDASAYRQFQHVYNDNREGGLMYYRLYCQAYTSGTINTVLQNVSPVSYGYGKLHSIVLPPVDTAYVWIYRSFPSSTISNSLYWTWGAWYEGNFPQAVTLYEGRLVWASKNRVDLTVVDDYYNFDRTIEGSSAAIERTIGFGPVENISWLESSNRLFMGLPSSPVIIRSSNFDEPLTPSNTNLRPGKGAGAKQMPATANDDGIYYVDRTGEKMFLLEHSLGSDKIVTTDQMMLHPDICSDGITRIVTTELPEKRIWVLTSAGDLMVLLKEPTEDVMAWSKITVDGVIQDISVEHLATEDRINMIVRRNSESHLCYLSEFSSANERPLDFYDESVSPGGSVTGLTWLANETVGVWADGQDRGDVAVSAGGAATLSGLSGYPFTNVVVGKRYTADYKSCKLGQYVAESVIGERKRVTDIALVMRDYAPGALQVGPDFTTLRDLPGSVAGAMVTDYDEQGFSFPGRCDTDSRICLRATGPCTALALAYRVNVNRRKKEND